MEVLNIQQGIVEIKKQEAELGRVKDWNMEIRVMNKEE